MKKILALIALLPGAAIAANSTADLSGGPAKKQTAAVQTIKTNGAPLRVKQEVNLYYTGPSRRSAAAQNTYAGCTGDGCAAARSARAETYRAANDKKYNLANPFYQPLKETFFSITDASFSGAGFKFDIDNGAWANNKGKLDNNSVSFTENLSYGITDNFAILGEVRFARDELRVKWDTVPFPLDVDKYDDSRLASFGAGFKWRVSDSKNWISFLFGGIENAKDVGNVFSVNTKIGYKNDDTTIYGLAGAQFINWDHSNGYGFGITNQYGQSEYFMLKEKTSNSIYYAAGAGLFAAINEDWSSDLQITYQDLEWHSQVLAQASIAYQPWNSVAVNLYGRFALWDNANGFNSDVYGPHPYIGDGTEPVVNVGVAKFADYREYLVGVQLLAAF
ncbi:MAG: hypothetical protein LBL46_04095 [Rickettsiales bacterium]|jgi:hypothetical protein|nr:hypothetical protein [Rickettsiales bacterium]